MNEAGSLLAIVFAAAAILSAALIWLLLPLLARYALARPNARSSHRTPTPQGGGMAVIGATTLVFTAVAVIARTPVDPFATGLTFACVIGLAALGATDDLRPLEALPRLLFQAIAVVIVLAVLPSSLQVFPMVPWWLERALVFTTMLWFVNAVNFMDGVDWMTVAEVVPVTAALALFGASGALPPEATFAALALCGAMVGFAPFNRPVARLFLGDVGSLPIGLLLGWLLLLLAANGHVAAAFLLPLYYMADATITLLSRLARGEPVLEAHRSHFYQKALDGGVSVGRIVAQVFVLNVVLTGLAAATLFWPSRLFHIAAFAAGCVLVGLLLYRFAHARA